jgi:hypothetical protein
MPAIIRSEQRVSYTIPVSVLFQQRLIHTMPAITKIEQRVSHTILVSILMYQRLIHTMLASIKIGSELAARYWLVFILTTTYSHDAG